MNLKTAIKRHATRIRVGLFSALGAGDATDSRLSAGELGSLTEKSLTGRSQRLKWDQDSLPDSLPTLGRVQLRSLATKVFCLMLIARNWRASRDYGIGFHPDGFRLEKWSPLRGLRGPLGLK